MGNPIQRTNGEELPIRDQSYSLRSRLGHHIAACQASHCQRRRYRARANERPTELALHAMLLSGEQQNLEGCAVPGRLYPFGAL